MVVTFRLLCHFTVLHFLHDGRWESITHSIVTATIRAVSGNSSVVSAAILVKNMRVVLIFWHVASFLYYAGTFPQSILVYNVIHLLYALGCIQTFICSSQRDIYVKIGLYYNYFILLCIIFTLLRLFWTTCVYLSAHNVWLQNCWCTSKATAGIV